MSENTRRLPRRLTKSELCRYLDFVFYGSERPDYQSFHKKILPPQYCHEHGIRIGRFKTFDSLETQKIYDRLRALGYKVEKIFLDGNY